MTDSQGPGGFLQPTLPSPPPSSTTSVSVPSSILPRPRNTPLKSGSAKESSFIDYVDDKLLGISRRYEKRFNTHLGSARNEGKEGRGYEGFGEMSKDLQAVIDVIWVSATRMGGPLPKSHGNSLMRERCSASLQVHYLLTIALTTCTSLPSFPYAPRSTFQLLKKLDFSFYSLLRGVDAETGETLPGFQGGRSRLSTTEKVRMRGLVERTRVVVVEVAGRGGSVADVETVTGTEDDSMTDDDDGGDDDSYDEDMRNELDVEGNHGRWEMELARVYEKTIVELGMWLGSSMGEPG